VRTVAYTDRVRKISATEIRTTPLRKPIRKSRNTSNPEWAAKIFELRSQLDLTQSAFGQRVHMSAMAISRWERGTQEPTGESYIGLGNLGGDPLCWYFWGRAGLRNEDLMRVMPTFSSRLNQAKVVRVQFVRAGGGNRKLKSPQLVAIPVLKCVASSLGEKESDTDMLHGSPVESMIAAPKDWCPNPAATTCLRVKGNSMNPLLYDGYILVADSSQTDPSKLDGKIVIAWHKDKGLTVSRLQAYDHTEVLRAENSAYESIVLNKKHAWKIVAKVLWWIGKAP